MANINSQTGFTITELIIATVLGSMMAITLFSITILFYGGVLRNDAQSRLVVESQNILRVVVEDLRTSSGVRLNNTITDPNGPVGGWTTSNDDLILIITEPTQDVNNEFIIDSLNNIPYLNEVIYFTNNGILYKRILANPDALGNIAETTCPAELVPSSCGRADRILSDNFDNMTFNFYDQDDFATNDPLLARSIAVNIYLTKRTLGTEINIDNKIRTTLRNSL